MLGKKLETAHRDDRRGLPMFPSDLRTKARTYEALLKELGRSAVFLPLSFGWVPAQRSRDAQEYEGGELVDEETGEIVRTSKHVDAPDGYEAELAALGLGSGQRDPFEDEDDDGSFDDDDEDEAAAIEREEAWQFGPPPPRAREKASAKRPATPSRKRPATRDAKKPADTRPKKRAKKRAASR